MNGNDSFGNWLKARRKALDLTQAELADQVGCAAITIRKIESDGYRPSKQISERLADILAISPQQRTEFVAFARGTGGSGVFVALMSAPRPHNLPIQQPPLIGRADELAQIAQRLADPACRLLTLVGVGGIGKTRLALQAAAEQLANFADGIYFVSLTGVSAPNLVASAMAGGLGISFYGPEDPHVQLVDYLREKKLLLVLDNFEHLLGATGLLTDTLAAAPAVKLLVTSRERLNLQEEWVIAVEGLAFPLSPIPSPVERDRGTGGYPAVQLFVQRARQVKANFSLEQDAASVVAICRYVEGMPLGLELAANWLWVMTGSQIAAQLAHSLDLPAMSPRNAPERHRSIRAIFDHSWALLTADEQAVFRKLAVFRGGFEREAAGHVANASLHSLAALIDKSLLRMNAVGRYDLHELVRQYAEQQLEASGETISAQAAHSAYYMGFLARLDADVKGRRQMAALREIRTDFDNIRAAWQWASEHRQHEAICRAANCLINVGEMTSVLPDVLAILQQTAATLAPAQGEPPHPVWEQVIVRREWANSHLQRKVDQESVETILEHARERSDQEEIAWCLWVLTDCAAFGDARDPAVALAEASLAQRRALGDEFYIAHALIGVCEFYWSFEFKRVLECTQESAVIRRRLGDMQGLCFSLTFLGEWQLLDSHLREADLYFDEGIALQEAHGKSQFYVRLIVDKAKLAFWRGEFELAMQLLEIGMDFARDQNYLAIRSSCFTVLSYVQSMTGNYTQVQYTSDPPTGVWANWGRALAYCGSGDDEAAHRSVRDTLRYSACSLTFQLLCLPLMSILSARRGDSQHAVVLLSLFSTAPRDLTVWADKWPLLTYVRTELERELGAEGYAATWVKGKALSLQQVIADALQT